VGLFLQRRARRGPRRNEEPARRQGANRHEWLRSASACPLASPSPPRSAPSSTPAARPTRPISFGANGSYANHARPVARRRSVLLGVYTVKGRLKADPFVTLDVEGVGELVTIVAERGRKTRPDLKLGVCGEHGGGPALIAFCEQAGLDYVSCSRFRIPLARLAAAQAALGREGPSTA
jgi:pyruvate, orthophosphate dikinase